MKISVLSSGSSGNCFYIESDKAAVLVDAGISAKQINERLNAIGRDTSKIRGILVTHEHSDHIKGCDVFARQMNIPIFATKKTIETGFLCSNENLIQTIKNNETFDLGGLKIEASSKFHKAADPVSFSILNGKKISIITDAGYACQNIIDSVSDSDFLCIESNHDVSMLENGPYPYFLKKWIKSDIGHLSNNQAGLCVLEHSKAKLKNIVLSHLSQTNNTPKLALSTFNSLIKERLNFKPGIFVSQKQAPTQLFSV